MLKDRCLIWYMTHVYTLHKTYLVLILKNGEQNVTQSKKASN